MTPVHGFLLLYLMMYKGVPYIQNVQLFVRSKTSILNVAIFKYSLHRFRETILH